jgi:nucleoside-diphosphate-sugar epimerase
MLARAPKPPVPAAGWPRLLAHPLLLDTTAARTRLGWQPRFTSRQAVESLRAALSA